MPLLDKNRQPTLGELRMFGLILATFFSLVGGLVLWKTGSWTTAAVIWISALLLCVFYYGVPTSQWLVFRVWIATLYPIGWIISHALLAIVYYLVITPIGLGMRLFGRDPLQRELHRSAKTYWTPRSTIKDTARYFQQF